MCAVINTRVMKSLLSMAYHAAYYVHFCVSAGLGSVGWVCLESYGLSANIWVRGSLGKRDVHFFYIDVVMGVSIHP